MIWFATLILLIELVQYLFLKQVLQQQQQIIKQGELLIMTVQGIKDQLAANRLALQTTVQEETAELAALIVKGGGGVGGATAADLVDISTGIDDNQTAALGLIKAMSDNVAAAPAPADRP